MRSQFSRNIIIKIIRLLFFAVLGFEPRALHILGKWSTTEVHPQSNVRQ
jgi:hypothetical protein